MIKRFANYLQKLSNFAVLFSSGFNIIIDVKFNLIRVMCVFVEHLIFLFELGEVIILTMLTF